MQEIPWFLKQDGDDDRTRINFVEIAWTSGWASEGGISRGSLDVPDKTFDAMLERAARHRGYTGHQRDLHEIVTRDATLQLQQHEPTADVMHGTSRVIKKRLIEARPFDGTPLLVRTYQRGLHPFSAFPCDEPVHSRRRVKRLELRVHRDARLVFETMQSSGGGSTSMNKVVRRVRLEIELKNGNGGGDLQRTVENTIQVVMLGMTPQGKGLQLGKRRTPIT